MFYLGSTNLFHKRNIQLYYQDFCLLYLYILLRSYCNADFKQSSNKLDNMVVAHEIIPRHLLELGYSLFQSPIPVPNPSPQSQSPIPVLNPSP